MPKAWTVMQIQAHLSQRAEAGLLLMPKMLQSIEVLQLASAELLGLIDRELAQNEVLEVVPAGDAEVEVATAPAEDGRGLDDGVGPGPRAGAGVDADGKQALLNSVPAGSDTLLDHLREQVAWLDLDPRLAEAVLALAEYLDERGFLAAEREELGRHVRAELLDEAIAVLRSLDPVGVGATNAIDALLMQVPQGDPDRADIHDLLTRHLALLAANKLPEVARLIGRSVEEVQALVDRIRALDPYPAARFRSEVARPVHPDLVVFVRDGELEIQVNDSDLPSLGVNEDYAAMLRAPGATDEVKRYLRPKLECARSLIQAVEQRRKTLARVGAAVLEYQREFLSHGVTAMRPLKMAEIAGVLQLHTSTVSRAVAGKYVQTDRGIYRLRDFFDGGRSRGGPGGASGTGRLGVQERIRELIATEEPDRPLSDDDLVTLLAASGIGMARRTVTKYRKELGIPSSWGRRRSWSGS